MRTESDECDDGHGRERDEHVDHLIRTGTADRQGL